MSDWTFFVPFKLRMLRSPALLIDHKQGANAAIKNKNGLTCYEGLDVVRQVT